MRPARLIGPAIVAAGLVVLIAMIVKPHPARSEIELGLLYSISRYDQMLPLLGLGFAFVGASRMAANINLVVFAVGVPAGGLVAAWLTAAAPNPLFPLGYVLVLGPAALLATGLALVVPDAPRKWALPAAALLCGGSLGLVIDVTDATVQEWRFAAGAILGGCAILVTPILLFGGVRIYWLAVAVRIFGSWLIAIGAMLGASVLIRM